MTIPSILKTAQLSNAGEPAPLADATCFELLKSRKASTDASGYMSNPETTSARAHSVSLAAPFEARWSVVKLLGAGSEI